jgi:hypothetical protein
MAICPIPGRLSRCPGRPGSRDGGHREAGRGLRDGRAARHRQHTAGDLARLDGEPQVARVALLRALEMADPPDVAQQIQAMAATGLGYLAGAQGDLDAARHWHARALAAARSASDAPVIAATLAGLADLALCEADPERADPVRTARSIPSSARVWSNRLTSPSAIIEYVMLP